MKCFMIATIMMLLMVGVSYGQPMGVPQMNSGPYLPGSTQQYVPQQIIPIPQTPTAPPLVPPNQEAWQSGWKETYTNTHEYRPIRPYEYDHRYQNDGRYDNRYPERDGWYYNDRTGNYQRNVEPTCYPQGQVYPQYQYQPTYCVPQPTYCQPQPTYYYQQPRRVWPWCFGG